MVGCFPINFNSISMPYASNGIYLENEAGYHKMSSHEHGIMVKIDVSGNVQIVFSKEHFNRTCGLCGNFNQFAEDDFLTQEGNWIFFDDAQWLLSEIT